MVSPFPVIQTRVQKKGKYLQARSCEIESCFCVDERRRFIYKVLLFIKVNIEPFFRRCGITTSPFFPSEDPILLRTRLEITPRPQVRALRDTTRGSVVHVIIPGSSPNTLSQKWLPADSAQDAFYYYFYF